MRSGRPAARVIRAIACVCGLAFASTASAQSQARVSVDSVAGVDVFRGEAAADRPDASVDIGIALRLSGGWSAYARPWFFMSSQGSEWSKEIYQAAVQYQRAGRVATRVDAGYIATPIGLGMLDMRADANPTIRPHLSYFVPLMPFDRTSPMVGPIVASYPLGAQLALSTTRWDARTAVLASAPTRRFALHADTPNPRATPVLVVGGGVTPMPGLRIGAAVAAGRYATHDEVSDPAALDRRLHMWSVEGEYAFGYTKLSGEFTRERFEAGPSTDDAASWFFQGTQTLSPRLFVAVRTEGISAPPFGGAITHGPRLTYDTKEVAIGFRVSPELTVRGSVFTSRFYARDRYDSQAGVSLVWSRRWW